MSPADIIAAARKELETPFRHQGRQPGMALDCAGLVVAVARSLGIDPVDVSGYARVPSGILQSILDQQPCLVRVVTMQPGDILLMRFRGDPQHLAIYAGDTIIHSYETVGRCCEHDFTDLWRRRVVAIYRFTEVAE